MNYIIGDIHANIKELKSLLDIVKFKKDDKLIFIGDYIDKNVYTKETIELLLFLIKNYSCILIKGNHDFVWDRYLNFQEFFRQDFLLTHGSVEALRQFSPEPEDLIKNNRTELIRKYLRPYLALIPQMVDYYITDNYLATHAGLEKHQILQRNLKFTEANYFLRGDKLNYDKKYLNKYTIIAGHTHLGIKPLIREGYINIDLGAGYGRYLGALCIEKKIVIRSDNKIFKL